MVLDHIGIACEDTSKFLETFTEMLNGHKQMPQLYDEMGISSTYVDFQSTKLELMEQVSETNVLKKFIEKRGGGLHHLSFKVENLTSVYNTLNVCGNEFLHEIKTIEKEDSVQRYTFFNLNFSNGILIELFDETKRSEGESYD